MNALDKAFIKAFAKNRVPSTHEPDAAKPHLDTRARDGGTESAPLVLHDLSDQGKRLRVDRPVPDAELLDAHMILSNVEHVESYEPEQVEHQVQPAVVFEDRLTGLEQDSFAAADDAPGDVRPTRTDAMAKAATSNVDCRTDADADRDVQALDTPAIPRQPAEQPSPLPWNWEEWIWEPSIPTTYTAAELTDHPGLLTVQYGRLNAAAELPCQDFSTEVEICWPDVDWDALELAARSDTHRSVTVPQSGDSPDACERTSEPGDDDVLAADVAAPVEDSAEARAVAAAGSASSDAVPRTAPKSFAPAWEVDAFRWPTLCQEWDEHTQGRLTQSGEELHAATREGLRVVVVTSFRRQEGRSSLTLSLARSAARAGARVALVDADSGNPELARRLGMEAPCDWREVIGRGEPLSEAAVASLEDGVTLFPRTYPADIPHGAVDESLRRTLLQLREHFDLVLVDLPPLRADGETTNREAPCPIDMALVVRNVQTTSQEHALMTVASLRELGVLAVGFIENFQRDGAAA